MYLITNRKVNTGKKDLDCFGKDPNPKGPNELRLVRVEKTGQGWQVEVVKDKLTKKEVRELNETYEFDIDTSKDWYGSLKVSCELFGRARKEKKSILFFVHGYNNDVEDVLKAAFEIEKRYNVIVVPFTWPANGGGIAGTASYLSDKSDARASAEALNRTVGKIQYMHQMLSRMDRERIRETVEAKHPDNPSAAGAEFTRLTEKQCSVAINLLCHSMGNYVFKHTLKTSENATSKLVFDNICLVAADTNNEDHVKWVGQLDVRKRVYVVINEDDFALKASRIKPGKEQKARLGHYLKRLNSPNATYVDLTGAPEMGTEHTYFKGDTVEKNARIKEMFDDMFNGKATEDKLVYRDDINTYRLK